MTMVFHHACADFAAYLRARGGSVYDPTERHRAVAFVRAAANQDRHLGYADRYAFNRACDLALAGDVKPLRRLAELHLTSSHCPSGDIVEEDPVDPGYAGRERGRYELNNELHNRLIAAIAELLRLPKPDAPPAADPAAKVPWQWWSWYERDGDNHYEEQRDDQMETFDEFVESLNPPGVIDATTDLTVLTAAVIGAWANGRRNPLDICGTLYRGDAGRADQLNAARLVLDNISGMLTPPILQRVCGDIELVVDAVISLGDRIRTEREKGAAAIRAAAE